MPSARKMTKKRLRCGHSLSYVIAHYTYFNRRAHKYKMGIIVCACSGQRSTSNVFLQTPYTPFFASAISYWPGTSLWRLGWRDKSQGAFYLCLPSMGIRGTYYAWL